MGRLTAALACLLAAPALAGPKAAAPLHAEPGLVALGGPRAVRLFVLFHEIPPADAPAMMYGAAGDVYRLGRAGAKTKVAELAHRLDLEWPPGRRGAGLEATLTVAPRPGERLVFVARIRNRDGWARWTEAREVRVSAAAPEAPEPQPEPDFSGIGPRDYAAMRKACGRDGCCLASVERMERAGYAMTSSGDCPPGHARDMLRCVTSLRWCAPAPR